MLIKAGFVNFDCFDVSKARAGQGRARHWKHGDKLHSGGQLHMGVSRCMTANYGSTALVPKVLLRGKLGRSLNSITLTSTARANACLAPHRNFCPTGKVNAGGSLLQRHRQGAWNSHVFSNIHASVDLSGRADMLMVM